MKGVDNNEANPERVEGREEICEQWLKAKMRKARKRSSHLEKEMWNREKSE